MTYVFSFALPSNFINLHIILRIIAAALMIRFLKKDTPDNECMHESSERVSSEVTASSKPNSANLRLVPTDLQNP
jgi:hypothetical protein